MMFLNRIYPHEFLQIVSLFYAFYLEDNWIVCIGTGVDHYVFVFTPWKFDAVAQCVDFGKQNHQRAVAYVALH